MTLRVTLSRIAAKCLRWQTGDSHLHCTKRTICLANRVQVSVAVLPQNDISRET